MEWLGEHAWAGWLALTAALGVAEMFSLDLVLIMLALGSAVALIAAVAGAPFLAQALLGTLAAVASLALLRPNLVKRLHNGPDLQVGHDRLVGTQGVVTEAISAQNVGRIKLAGEIWSAAPYDEFLSIAPGETVEVFAIRGATAYVHPVPTLES